MSFVEPIRATRTFEAAIEHVIEGIEQARLRPGDRLPSEGQLAAQLGISKPTLRQALRILERAGLLVVRPGKGGGIFLGSALVPTEAISSEVALEEHHVVDVLRGRRVLERAVTHVAAAAMTEEDVVELERANQFLRRHQGERPLVMRADAMFHRAVTRATHNATLQAAMRAVARDLAPIRDAYSGGPQQDAKTLEVHERQVAAMEGDSAAELDRVLHEHFAILERSVARAIGSEWNELFGSFEEAAARESS
jgi:GntR family transcriptional repressor for pyruvate dehydrogenase complex